MKSKYKHKIILITGGGGYIGTHITDKLLQAGYKVRIFDQFIFGENVVSDLKKNKNLRIIKGEIGDWQKLRESLNGVDTVIHLAGLVGDPACIVNKELTVQMNIVSTRIVKELSKDAKVSRFIFSSSCSVYGASDELVNERSRLSALSLYAQTKIDSEKEILSDRSSNFHPTILRFATVFGHSRRPRFDLVANLFVAQAYNDGLITVTGSSQWRPFIHPKDIARAILVVLEKPEKEVDRQIINVGDDNLNITIRDLAYLVADIVKKDRRGESVRVLINDDIADKRNYRVSFKKIKKLLSFEASISIREGLEEIYDNFKKGGYKEDYKDPLYINVEMTKLLHITNVE
ncbi:MAG: SDR family oxidoreductase [Candidatus Daviesbacteria bacterium]|nr:SDR family oxidoreductase [Candidatus Daviesbacteria bacterium]